MTSEANEMKISPLAGKPAPKSMLIDVARLEKEYFERHPDMHDPNQLVSFGTSGHRGSSLNGTFTEAHILAITQAICDYRREQGTGGPLYMGKDTHALSAPAQRTALEVLAANNVETVIQKRRRDTPTPVISRAILARNRGRRRTPRRRHRRHAVAQPARGRRLQVQPAQRRPGRHRRDALDPGSRQRIVASDNDESSAFRSPKPSKPRRRTRRIIVLPYVRDLKHVVDMDAIRGAHLRLAVDPLGGAARPYWEPINSMYGLDITVVNPAA
jgi:phosphoglucomutase